MEISKWVISIPARKKKPVGCDRSQVIRISPKAYDALVEIYNESVLPMSQVASMLILAAAEHVIYEKEESNES